MKSVKEIKRMKPFYLLASLAIVASLYLSMALMVTAVSAYKELKCTTAIGYMMMAVHRYDQNGKHFWYVEATDKDRMKKCQKSIKFNNRYRKLILGQ